MMSEVLLGCDASREAREKRGRSAQNLRASSLAPYSKSEPRKDRASSSSKREEARGGSDLLTEGRRGKSRGDLRANAERLMNEIDVAEALSSRLQGVQAPFQQAFWEATSVVVGIHENRKAGRQTTKAVTLAAYDARVVAGHRWHPHRRAYQDTLRWLKALRVDLAGINREIGT